MKKNADRRIISVLLFAVIFSFFFFLMFCSPYGSDDYAFLSWNFHNFSEIITNVLQYGNGRILGNLINVVMLHYPAPSFIIRALMITSIIFMIPKILGIKSTLSVLAVFLLITACDPVLFGQVYLWTSGFYNYIPPLFLMLLIVYIRSSYYNANNRIKQFIMLLVVLFFGVCSQLFIEHASVIHVILSASFLLFALIEKNQKSITFSSIWFLSTVFGIIIMFSIPVIFYVKGNSCENYHYLNIRSITSLLISCVKNTLTISEYYVGLNSLPLILGSIITIHLTSNNKTSTTSRASVSACIISGGVLLFGRFIGIHSYHGKLTILIQGLYFVCVFTLFLIWFVSSFSIKDNVVRNKVIFLLFIAFMSLAPLLIVHPIPTRTVFLSYVFFCLAALVCLHSISKDFSPSIIHYIQKGLIIAFVCIILMLSVTFIGVRSLFVSRNAYIEQEMRNNATKITIFQIPYEYTDFDKLWSYPAYFFHNTQGDIEFSQVPCIEWMNDYYPMIQFSDKP